MTHWLPLILYAALIFYVSSQTLPEAPIQLPDIDKIAHCMEYGLFTFLAYRVFSKINSKAVKKHIFLMVLIVSILYAFSDEWHQLYVPGRQMDSLDFLFDALGTIIITLLLQINDLKTNYVKFYQGRAKNP